MNGLVGLALPKSARIRSSIRVVRSELAGWLEQQPFAVRHAGAAVVHGLCSALIGAHPNPAVVKLLAEDVEKLKRARADSRSEVCA